VQNVQIISRVAMSPAGRITGTGPTRSESMALTPYALFHGNTDRLAVGGSVRCRWRAADDGTLRMEWLNTPST
jgi:hypothetical protein